MIQKVIISKVLKLVTSSLAKKFKLSKLLKYMERPNDCDVRVDKLEEDVKELKKMAYPSKIDEDVDSFANKLKQIKEK